MKCNMKFSHFPVIEIKINKSKNPNLGNLNFLPSYYIVKHKISKEENNQLVQSTAPCLQNGIFANTGYQTYTNSKISNI